jgi:hypothetical protein
MAKLQREQVDRARQDVAALRNRLEEQEDALEEAEQRAADEERAARRARQSRLTERELQQLEGGRSTNRPLLSFAVDELRDLVFSTHDRSVLAGICERLDGYERDLVERLLAMTASRSGQ